MATIPVKLKRSATPGKIPTTAQLALGEIGINTFDGKAYIKKNDGTESIVELGSAGGYTAPKALSLYNKDGGGSVAVFNGIETRFQLRDAGGALPAILSALSVAVSLNGVVQKPNEGTPGTFDGFYVTPNVVAGYDIVFSEAPATGSDFFCVLGGTFSSTAGRSAITYIDDLSSQFNGTLTSFTLKVNGSTYSPEYTVSVLVVLGGIVQTPNQSYTISGSTITFTEAPPSGTDFHAVDFRIAPSADLASAIIHTGDTPPADPADGQLWYDSTGGRAFVYYDDGTSAQWVDASPATVGGTVQLAGGTGASPSLTFATDTDTGVYSSTANNLAFATGGSGRVFIDGSGNVGINNSSPTDRLTIYNASSDVWVRTHTSTYNAYTGVNTGSGTIDTYVASNHPYRIVTNNLERLRVTADGKVGINESSPTARLQVNGEFRSQTGSTYLAFNHDGSNGSIAASGGNMLLYAIGNNNMILHTNNNNRLTITGAGNVGINTATPRTRFEINGDFLSNQNAAWGSNLYYEGQWKYAANGIAGAIKASSSTGNFEFLIAANNTAGAGASANPYIAMSIATSGNVGIGQYYPQKTLHLSDPSPNYGGVQLGNTVNNGYYSIVYNNANDLQIIANGDQSYRQTLGTNDGTGNIRFYTAAFTQGNTERMVIRFNGNVGINTTDPQDKLTVRNGNISIRTDNTSTDTLTFFEQYDGTNYISAWVGLANWNKRALQFYAPAASGGGNVYAAAFASGTWNFGGNVTFGSAAAAGSHDIYGYTTFGRYGGTYQGLSLANNNDSSTAETVSFIDSKNNLGIADSDLFFTHNTNGSSHVQFDTTPAGSRSTDRRRIALRVNGNRNIESYQDAGQATIDTSVNSTTLAANATVDFANSSGMLVVNNWTSGGVTIYLCGGGSVTVVSSVIGQVGTLTWTGSVYRFTNNFGATATFGFFFVRTRPNP